jgi:hypothetical protein
VQVGDTSGTGGPEVVGPVDGPEVAVPVAVVELLGSAVAGGDVGSMVGVEARQGAVDVAGVEVGVLLEWLCAGDVGWPGPTTMLLGGPDDVVVDDCVAGWDSWVLWTTVGEGDRALTTFWCGAGPALAITMAPAPMTTTAAVEATA